MSERLAPNLRSTAGKSNGSSNNSLRFLPTFLLGPAMEWVVQCVAFNAVSYSDLHPLWEYCRLPERRAVVLLPMLNALPRLYLGEHALEACRIVTGSEMELCAFGANLLETEVPVHSRKSILKAVWKCVMRLASLKHYMDCCECWVEFAARHFGTNEVNVMLDNMLTKLNQQQQLKDKYGFYQPQLLAVLRKVFTHSRDVATLFGMDVFIKFVDTFNAGPIREEVFLIILRALVAKHSVASFTSIDLAYQVLSTCQSLHDCVEPTSSDDRVHSVVGLISASLDRVDLSADPDQCLDFLVSCRANLANIDGLQKYVFCRVQAFTLHIVRSVRFSNSRAAFLQGCLANLFISTPSLADPLDQIHFGIRSTQIALAALAFFQVNLPWLS
ncbi:hypothetical protein niasHT_007234 [Heterodera trifolii]|uniref:Uncharacterized protein n=1 Tax=Heterodera trifolii TaxID=157864 RepID=A0ABD2LL81_9BILA